MDDDAQSGVCFTAKVLRIEPNFPLDDSHGAGWEKTGCGVGSARQCPSHWQMVRQVVAETLGVDVPLRMMEKWRTQHEKDKFQVLCDLTESPLVPKPAHRGLVVGTGDLELLRLPFWRRGGGGSTTMPISAVRARMRLRLHPSIVHQLSRWWRTVQNSTGCDMALDRSSFLRGALLLSKAMSKDHADGPALHASSVADYENLADPHSGSVSRADFLDFIFQIADAITETVVAEEYAIYLRSLHHHISSTTDAWQWYWRDEGTVAYHAYLLVRDQKRAMAPSPVPPEAPMPPTVKPTVPLGRLASAPAHRFMYPTRSTDTRVARAGHDSLWLATSIGLPDPRTHPKGAFTLVETSTDPHRRSRPRVLLSKHEWHISSAPRQTVVVNAFGGAAQALLTDRAPPASARASSGARVRAQQRLQQGAMSSREQGLPDEPRLDYPNAPLRSLQLPSDRLSPRVLAPSAPRVRVQAKHEAKTAAHV